MAPERPLKEVKRENQQRAYILIAGFFLLGIALAFLLFGGRLFSGRNDSSESGLQQLTVGDRIESGEIPVPLSGAPLNVGDPAHNFVLPDLTGEQVDLDDFQGRPVIVNFWATWCPPCRLEMPEFQQVYEAHRDDDLVILAVNEAEAPETVRSFFYDEMGFTYTPLLDSETQVGELYGAVGLPATFFIDAGGEVTAIHRGALTAGQLERYLEETIP